MEKNMSKLMFNKLTPAEAAEALGVTTGTLAVWRCTKRYQLPFVKVGSKIFYRTEDIQSFLDNRTFCKLFDDEISEGRNNVLH